MMKIHGRKKEEILILNSDPLSIHISSFITSLIFTGLIFIGLLLLYNYQLNQKITISCVIFFITCVISSDIINLEYYLLTDKKLNFKPPLQLILVYIIILAIGLLNSPDVIRFTRQYNLSKYSIEFLLPLILIALVVTNVICFAMRSVFFKFLESISKINCWLIQEGNMFRHNLEIKFSTTKRYGGALSLIVFTAVSYIEDKIHSMNIKHQKKLISDILEIMRNNMRGTDILGNFEGGQICGILSNTDVSGAKVAASRIIEIINNYHGLKDEFKKNNICIKCGISKYDSSMEECEEMIENAINALNKIKEDKSKTIAC